MPISDPPKVTVFIPVYNREQYIGPAIDSILAQSYPNYELLLIDDGSTDRSVEIMRAYTDPRIRLTSNGDNLGIPKTRNKGIELARGEYMAMLDSDDLAHPKRLEKQVAFLDRHPDYAEVGSWGQAIDAQGRPLGRVKRKPVSPEDIHAHLLFVCCLNNRSIMARTAILQAYGYRNDYLRCADYELHVRLAKKYKLANLPEVLAFGRVHPYQDNTPQTIAVGRAKRQEIAGFQLADLGVAFTETDLERQFTLSRMRKLGVTPDRSYLEWAEAWLLKLQEANLRTQRYTERAFARTLGEKWVQACWAARAGMGWTVWKYFVRSPLRKGAGSLLKQELLARLHT
jgi:hypothetical protein